MVSRCEDQLSLESTSTDACGNGNLTATNNYDGTTIPDVICPDEDGGLTITFTVGDECGNETTCTANIIIRDTEAPEITTCPADLVMECGDDYAAGIAAWLADAKISLESTSTDACGNGNLTATNNYDGTTIPDVICPDEDGGLTITFTVADECGNETTCTANIIIRDTEAPEITTCPADLVMECGDDYAAGIAAWLADAKTSLESTSTDACGNGNLTATNNYDGTTIPDVICPDEDGGLTITFTVGDECGNETTCTANIIIRDTQAPEITTCPADLVMECGDDYAAGIAAWLADAKTSLESTSTDACGNGNLTATNNYDGTTIPDVICPDEDGGLTITFTVADECGNETDVYSQHHY